MVERWTCKYCDVTINDDAPSRAAHEGGLRHKSAVERALKQTYRRAERDRRDAAIQAREMAKIERAAAAAASGSGVGPQAGEADAGSSASAGTKRKHRGEDDDGGGGDKSAAAGPKEWKPKDKFAAYTTAANLGFGEDPAEAKAREEQELRQKEGFASEWTVVETAPPSSSASQLANNGSNTKARTDHVGPSSAQRAQPAPTPADDDDLRAFRTKEKAAPTLEGEDDEDAAAAPLEFKKRTKKRRT